MDFALSPDQELLRGTARVFLDEHVPPAAVRALWSDPRGERDDLWKELARLGWLGLALPEVHGGATLRLNAAGAFSLPGVQLFADGGAANTIVDGVGSPTLTFTGTNAITAVLQNPATATGISSSIASVAFGGAAGTA